MSTIGVKAIKYPDGDSAINITDGGNVTLAGTLGVTGETTLATHLNLGDNDRIKIGAGSDIQIYHDGSYSRIMESGGTALVLDTTSADIRLTADNSEVMGKFVKNGAVQLFYDNSQKFSTTTSGVTITGVVGISESSPAAGLHITSTNNDLSKIRLGYSTSNHFLEIGRQAGYYRLASFEDGQSLTFGTSRSAGATTERMRINADGQTTISNQPSFQGGIGALHGAGTLKCNSVYHNQGSHYSTSTGLFTAPVTGKYLVGIMVMTQSNYTLDVGMTINGSVSNMFVPYQAATGGGHQQVSGVAVVAVSANDTIGFNVNSGDVYGGSNGRHSSVTFHLLS